MNNIINIIVVIINVIMRAGPVQRNGHLAVQLAAGHAGSHGGP